MKQFSLSMIVLLLASAAVGCQNSRNKDIMIGKHDFLSKLESMPLSEAPEFARQGRSAKIKKGQDPFMAMGPMGQQSAFDEPGQSGTSRVATARVSMENPNQFAPQHQFQNQFAQPQQNQFGPQSQTSNPFAGQRPPTSHDWAPQPKSSGIQPASGTATVSGPQPFPEQTGNSFKWQNTTDAHQESREGFQQPVLHADHNTESFYHPQPQQGVGRAKVGL